MQQKPELQVTIAEMKLEDIEQVTEMRLQSWLDTYVNPEHGVTREWIEARNNEHRSESYINSRRERFLAGKAQGTFAGWVACTGDDALIGTATAQIDEDGVQSLGSLYVDKQWLGAGVGSQLMQKVIDWFDSEKPIHLGVVRYNERAKAFYRKWGFKEIAGSEGLLDGVMPEVKMLRDVVRPGDAK